MANFSTLLALGGLLVLGHSTRAQTFATVASYFLSVGSMYPQAIVAADVNGDGRPDLLTADGGGTASVLLGTGTGTFQQVGIYTTNSNSYPVGITAADVNGDNRLDILTANFSSGSVGVLLNTTPTPLVTRATLPGTSATLAPNSATDRTTLSVAGLPAAVTQVQATLLDATGRAVGQQPLAATHGTARAEVPTVGLAAGLYMLRLAAYDAQDQLAGSLPTQHLSVQ